MKSKIFAVLFMLMTSCFILLSPLASAITCDQCSTQSNLNTSDAIQCGTNCASGNDQNSSQASDNASSTVSSIINLLSLAAGAIAVIMIVVGGFRYVTSGGKQETVTAAKNTITYAIIGLVLVALAQLIVHFVLNKTSNALTPAKKTGTNTIINTGPH